jgi:hypothetical protein
MQAGLNFKIILCFNTNEVFFILLDPAQIRALKDNDTLKDVTVRFGLVYLAHVVIPVTLSLNQSCDKG